MGNKAEGVRNLLFFYAGMFIAAWMFYTPKHNFVSNSFLVLGVLIVVILFLIRVGILVPREERYEVPKKDNMPTAT
jgi:hypothetical protein